MADVPNDGSRSSQAVLKLLQHHRPLAQPRDAARPEPTGMKSIRIRVSQIFSQNNQISESLGPGCHIRVVSGLEERSSVLDPLSYAHHFRQSGV
jgi:hypothetical protein